MANTRVLIQYLSGGKWRTHESWDYSRDREGNRSGYRMMDSKLKKYQEEQPEKKWRTVVKRAGQRGGPAAGGAAATSIMFNPSDQARADEVDLLDLIAKHEGGYNTFYGGQKRPLTKMSIDQVISQPSERHGPYKSDASGRYQFMGYTLKGLKRELGLSGNEQFSPELQDKLAMSLMKRRGLDDYMSGRLSAERFANNLAKEWASLPTSSGGSYYGQGTGSHTFENVLREVKELKSGGLSIDDATKATAASFEEPETVVQDGGEEPSARAPRTFIENLERTSRQFGAGFMRAPGDVYGLLGLLTAPFEYGARKIGVPLEGSPTGQYFDQANSIYDSANQVFGIDEPENIAEQVASFAGPSLLRLGPGKAVQGPVRNLLELATPFTVGGGAGRVAANTALQATGGEIGQELLDLDPGYTSIKDMVFGSDNVPAPLPKTEEVYDKPIVPFTGEVVQAGVTPPIPDVPDNLGLLAGLGFGTVALATGPSVVRALKPRRTAAPRLIDTTGRRVPDTLTTLEDTRDLLRTQTDDALYGVKSTLRKSGAAPDVVEKLSRYFDLETLAGGRAHVMNGIKNGDMNSIAGLYNVRVPVTRIASTVDRLPTVVKENAQELIRLYDRLDDAKRFGSRAVGATQAVLKKQIAQIERAYPALRPLKEAYRDSVKEMRRFIADGEFGLVSKRRLNELNRLQPNWAPAEIDLAKGLSFHERAALNLGRPSSSAPGAGLRKHPLKADVPIQDPFKTLLDRTYVSLQTRIENEVIGQYIDAMRRSPLGIDTFKRVTQKDLQKNPKWRDQVVTLYRRGKPEYYVTSSLNADILKFDPFYVKFGPNAFLYGTKRFMEETTTGRLAPWFAPIQAWRDVRIGKVTAPPGFKKPTYRGALWSIPKQLTAHGARAASEAIQAGLDTGSGGMVSKMIGAKGAKALSDRLAATYHRSLVSMVEQIGSPNVAITQQQLKLQSNTLAKIAQDARLPRVVRSAISGWKLMIDSIHNSGKYSFIARNVKAGKKTPREIISTARELTGNPTKGGQSYAEGRPLRLDPMKPGLASTIAPRLVGPLAEAGRLYVPWFNPAIQGIRRFGQSYIDNPYRFTTRMWAYVGLPAATGYFWNAALGPDYIKHQMERRSDYQKTMNLYVGLPGLPPEQGLEIPLFHEGALMSRLMIEALDNAFRQGDQMVVGQEDFWNAATSWLGVVGDPALPPFIGGSMAAFGVQPPFGTFGGLGRFGDDQARMIEEESFDTLNHTPKWLETFARAVGGGLGSVIGPSYNALMEGGPGAAGEEAAFQVYRKLPALPGVLGHKTINSHTEVQDELFKKQDAIRDLTDFYRAFDSEFNERNPDRFNVDPASKAGGKAADRMGIPQVSDTRPGVVPRAPDNPIYTKFMKTLYDRFGKDKDGFLSMWRRYGDATEKIRSLRPINAGNFTDYSGRVMKDKEAQRIARIKGFDLNTRQGALRLLNEYEKIRQDIGKSILVFIKETERIISTEAGVPIRIEEVNPYLN